MATIKDEIQTGVITAESEVDQKLIQQTAVPAKLSAVPQAAVVIPRKKKSRIGSYFLRGGVALRYRNYRLFFFGQLISLIGTWMQNVSQDWLVLKLTNSAFALGVTTALQFLPTMLLSLFGGIIADKFPKRRTLIVTQSTAMMLAFILALLTTLDIVQLWEVFVIAGCLGLVNAIDMPVRQSFVSEMVSKETLVNAIALNSSVFNAARVVGPAVAGILIGVVGLAAAFWLNGLSYIAVIVGLIMMNNAELFVGQKRKQTGSIGKNLKEGLSYVRHTNAIFTVIVSVAIVGTFGINFNVWMPVIAKNYLNVGADGYGILMSGLGIGALTAALTLATKAQQPTISFVMKGIASLTFFGIAIALSPWYLLTFVCLMGLGASLVIITASANTIVQMTVPDYLRGRVMSIYMLVFAGTTPIGSLFVGWLASVAGTPFSMATGMTLSIMAVPVAWLILRSQKKTAEHKIATGTI